MKTGVIAAVTLSSFLACASAAAQVAGTARLGVTVTQTEALVAGWSSKRDLMGKTVLNDQHDKIGKIEDIIIAPDNTASFAIIGVGGFLGMGRNDVAIPMDQLKVQGANITLPGSTKEVLKGLPKFEYTKKGSKV
ncbi:MAG TPA: PRC-barrel domain-containing protein [Janthinobacterium sp.]|jgi:hypothetical protein|nr:PRC-barrel domain-containing protein [Janthinobacterium sp.]